MKNRIQRISMLVCVAGACLCLRAAGSSITPPKSSPLLDSLVEMCGGTGSALSSTPLPLDKLKATYMDLEWDRLRGKAAPPELADDKDNKKKRGRRIKYSSPLTAGELSALESWFGEQPPFREKFLLALNPYSDDLPAAARVALKLRERFPKESDTLANLVLAFSVVWDSPRTVKSRASEGIPELWKKPPEMVAYDDSFGWFVAHQSGMAPAFAATPWRLLKYLSGESIALSERDWAVNKAKYSPDLGKVYSTIVYDRSKLDDDIGKLGKNPYTLENLAKYGGVCRDQAYYARTFCRAAGMPAYIASGTSNAGGGHAWVGWIVHDAKGYHLMQHGRYSEQKFYTAEILSPDSGEHIYDYMVGIEAEGLSDEKTYDEADLLYRLWEECGSKLSADARNKLLIEGLRRNSKHRAAWMAVGEATASGELPKESAQAQWNYLTASFQVYPDFVYAMLESFSRMNKEPQSRYAFYELGVTMFKKIKRDDLVAALRLQETDMFHEANMDTQAATVCETGTIECAGEGVAGAKLAKRAVTVMKDLKQEPRAINLLTKILPKTPKTDSVGDSNPNFVVVVTLLRDLYKDAGDAKKEAEMQAKLESASKKKDKSG